MGFPIPRKNPMGFYQKVWDKNPKKIPKIAEFLIRDFLEIKNSKWNYSHDILYDIHSLKGPADFSDSTSWNFALLIPSGFLEI